MKVLFSHLIKNPKHEFFDGEDNDEHIILTVRRHLITNLGWISFAIILFYLPAFVPLLFEMNGIDLESLLPASYRFILWIFWYLIVFGYVFMSYLGWFFNVYLITNKRVIDIDFAGLAHRRFSEAYLYNIEDLTHQISGALQVIFHFGTVHVQTAGEISEIEFENIPRPDVVQDVISDLVGMEKRRSKHDD